MRVRPPSHQAKNQNNEKAMKQTPEIRQPADINIFKGRKQFDLREKLQYAHDALLFRNIVRTAWTKPDLVQQCRFKQVIPSTNHPVLGALHPINSVPSQRPHIIFILAELLPFSTANLQAGDPEAATFSIRNKIHQFNTSGGVLSDPNGVSAASNASLPAFNRLSGFQNTPRPGTYSPITYQDFSYADPTGYNISPAATPRNRMSAAGTLSARPKEINGLLGKKLGATYITGIRLPGSSIRVGGAFRSTLVWTVNNLMASPPDGQRRLQVNHRDHRHLRCVLDVYLCLLKAYRQWNRAAGVDFVQKNPYSPHNKSNEYRPVLIRGACRFSCHLFAIPYNLMASLHTHGFNA
ncbi:hypothetical protein HUJ04_005650 [Dendroctonus ponderosae]|nr:hypothetical protein HUJ04_005650 [Dendroctonus ponderosae]